jgi:hypothetical protein
VLSAWNSLLRGTFSEKKGSRRDRFPSFFAPYFRSSFCKKEEKSMGRRRRRGALTRHGSVGNFTFRIAVKKEIKVP